MSKSQVFNDNPAAMAQDWLEQGATKLHVVDLDGAKVGQPVNLAAIARIVEMVKKTADSTSPNPGRWRVAN